MTRKGSGSIVSREINIVRTSSQKGANSDTST